MVESTNVLEILKTEQNAVFGSLYDKYRDLAPNSLSNAKLKEVLKDFCNSLSLTTNTDEFNFIESFKMIHRNLTKFKTLEEFCKVLISWVGLNKLQYIPVLATKQQYTVYLNKLKKYYEKVILISSQEAKPQLSAAIAKINSKISQLSKIYYFEPPTLVFRIDYLPSEKSVLQEIFYFYANSHIIISKFTTFDGLKMQKQLWNCGVFIKFCSTFKLSIRPTKQNPSIKHKTLIEIFSKYAVLKKFLDYSGFVKTLEDLAYEFFKIPANSKFPLDSNQLSPNLCKIALMDYLKILNIAKIRKILKDSVKCFAAPDFKPRIAENDPCFSYKFTVSASVYNKLKQLRIEKEEKKTKKKVSSIVTEPSVRVRSRPMSSYQSVQNLRKSADIVKVFNHVKSKGSLADDLILENC